MKRTYKGFDLDAHREPSLGGDVLLYFSIFRQSDGYELNSGFTTGSDRVVDYIGYLKEEVDDFILNPQDYEDEWIGE